LISPNDGRAPPDSSVNIPQDTPHWHTIERQDACRLLVTSPDDGLSSSEAERRLSQHGPNELQEAPRPGLWQLILEQFNNFIVLLLIGAAIVSAVLGEEIEAGAIAAIVLLNAILGVLQERRAEEALAALRKLAAPDALAIRGGHRESVPARELVPGDVVLLESGNYVPADLRLLESVNLRVEEAPLTGESLGVDKDAALTLSEEAQIGDRLNMAYMGTLVSYGRGKGLVTATGMETQIGTIASMLQSVETEQTPLQRRLDQLGKLLGWAALAICGLVFLFGWLRGVAALEMFLVAVSLAVAAVPEGLAAVVTITLALGMREMIQRHALIRRLSSVETLGSTTVICSDKTGTLTQNQMAVTELWVDGTTLEVTGGPETGHGEFRLAGEAVNLSEYPAVTTALWVAALDNDAVFEPDPSRDGGGLRIVGAPTEVALVVAAAKAGARRAELERAYPRIHEIPFDSSRKRMTTLHKVQDPRPEDPSPFYDLSRKEWEVVATKGAPDVVLELCSQYQDMQDQVRPLDEASRQRILAANDAMAERALRVLAVAYRVEPEVASQKHAERIERGLIFVGLFGMIDPPRREAPAAIRTARRAGIRTVMITGDYPNTARAIAEQVGLLQPGHQVTTGADLDGLDDDGLIRQVERIDVYARVSPEHKVRIVDALKAHREIVAMTGDGVNDAPALKRADIGVAMGITGTDVAKETADMVLTDDNFASIVSAVEQGRVIYANIRKFVYYLLSCNMAEIMVIFLAILAGLPSPLTAIQLLWLNLVTDGAPALALGLEAGDPDTMLRPPRPADEAIINRPMRVGILVQTIAITAVTLGAYAIGLSAYPAMADTMAFVTLSTSELLRAFTARSERYPLLRIGILSNRMMLLAVLSSLILIMLVVYVPALQPAFDTLPLAWAHWRLLIPLLLVPAVVAEVTKLFLRPRREESTQ
jgi:Ca2+-transporting ATPase